MSFDPFSAAFDLIKTGLQKWIPDANIREQAARELANQVQTIALAQIEVNKAEAQHSNLFIAGWRPAVGWICASALGYTFVLQPFLIFILLALGVSLPPLPVLDWSSLSIVLTGMLGLGAMRSFEKSKGVAS